MVCKHLQQIIDLQLQITAQQTKQFLPLQCDHAKLEQRIQTLTQQKDDVRRRPAAPGNDEDLWQELADITQDAQQSGEEARTLRMLLANALRLAPSVALAAPQAAEDREQKFADFSDLSGSDRTMLQGWIAQLRMVIQHKPTSFPKERSRMRYAFNLLSRVAIGQIMPHIRENGMIGLDDLPAFIQLLESTFENPNQVATSERFMRTIKQGMRKFRQ
jgi:hypothetical protein